MELQLYNWIQFELFRIKYLNLYNTCILPGNSLLSLKFINTSLDALKLLRSDNTRKLLNGCLQLSFVACNGSADLSWIEETLATQRKLIIILITRSTTHKFNEESKTLRCKEVYQSKTVPVSKDILSVKRETHLVTTKF